MDALKELIQTGASEVVNNSGCLFSAPARVVSVEGNQKYRVQLVISDVQYVLDNYSGSDLYVGETVQIYYRNNYISEQTAYIGSSFTKDSGHMGGLQFRKMSQADYDAIATKDNNTVYYVVSNGAVKQYLGDIEISGGSANISVSGKKLIIN